MKSWFWPQDKAAKDIDNLVDLVETIFENNLPVRVGIIFTGDSEEAYKRGAILNYLVQQYNKEDKAGIFGWDKWNQMREDKFSDSILKKKYSKGKINYELLSNNCRSIVGVRYLVWTHWRFDW